MSWSLDLMKRAQLSYTKTDYLDNIIFFCNELKKSKEFDELERIIVTANRTNEDRTIFIIGNGGSAAISSHITCDLNKKNLPMPRLVSLTDNTPLITALANDFGYDQIFQKQLEYLAEPGDILIAISGSGNSQNVINAIEYANRMGNVTVGITGFNGGILKKIARYSVNSNIDDMQVSEDIHMILVHFQIPIFAIHSLLRYL